MSWVTPENVEAVYPNSNVSAAFIAHVQSLAEICVGEHDEPSAKLKAAFTDVVYRKHLATVNNPEAVNQETLGSYSYSMTGAPGLGLTDKDCKSLKKAAGLSGLWVQPTTRGPVETPSDRLQEVFE
jgi:hypothetical protein